MLNITVLLDSLLIGIAVITVVNHLILSVITADRLMHRLFAVMAISTAIFNTGNLVSYYSQTITDMAAAHHWRIFAACVFSIVYPWFAEKFTGHKLPLISWAASLTFAALLLINFLSPYSLAFSSIDRLDLITMPWGGQISRAIGPVTIGLRILYLAVFLVLLYSCYLAYLQYRQGKRAAAIALISSIGIFGFFIIINFYVITGKISFMFTGTYGFFAFIITMSLYLAGRLRRSVKLLEQNEQQLRSIIDNTDAVIYIKDNQGAYRMVNRRFEQIFGVTLDQLRGKTDIELFSPADAENLQRNDATILKHGDGMEFEESFDLEGSEHTYISLKVPLRDSANQVYGICGISTDITERKRLERELRSQKDLLEEKVADRTKALEKANSELEAFSYAVSHDLRAPLRAIHGFSSALLDEYRKKLDEDGQDFLNRINKATLKLREMIEALLDLSRIERQELKTEDVNLSALADEIVRDLQDAEPDRQIKIQIEDNLVVHGDPRLLRIVLTNLLSNAWKYTGSVETPMIEVGSEQIEDGVYYFVRDNGAGFDMAFRQNLLAPFRRLHSDKEFPGLGIGLSIVDRIIKRHGGILSAEGKVGAGAVFSFSLG